MATERDLSLLLTYRDVDPASPIGLIWCVTDEDVEAVGLNAVRKSFYAGWERMADCAEFINQFAYVLVATPDDREQMEIVNGLKDRIEVPLLVADKASFRGTGSAAELFDAYGASALQKLIYGAIEIPRAGLIDLSTVSMSEAIPKNRVVSGFVPLDYCTGGFCGGQVSIWTGRRGEGKSTLLGQILVEAVNQSRAVCAYSGELPAAQFKKSVVPQIAGPGNLRPVPDPRTGRTEWVGGCDEIDAWLEGKFFLTDIRQARAHDEDYIISLFEYAFRRYGCSVFLVDNIMTAELKGEVELGHLGAQKAFTRRLCSFAKANDVHVHMVAHPRKAGDGALSADDIAGANEIGNLADKLFSVERKENFTLVRILKDRQTGSRAKIELEFDEKSKRFYDRGGSPDKRYSWEAARDGHG